MCAGRAAGAALRRWTAAGEPQPSLPRPGPARSAAGGNSVALRGDQPCPAMMLPAAGPSPGQTCGAVLVAAVLLQSVCVAVTFLYFTNELKQVGGGGQPGGRRSLLFSPFILAKNRMEGWNPCSVQRATVDDTGGPAGS